jgi:chorismate mutase
MADGRVSEPAELRRLRRRIDALDRRLVRLLNERAELARDVGLAKASTGRRAIRDPEREREVLLRVSMANHGPTPQADLIAIFKRLFAVARSLERRDRIRNRSTLRSAAASRDRTGAGSPARGSAPPEGLDRG